MKCKKGFTFPELIIAIAVLAIITAVVMTSFLSIKNSVLDRQYLNLKIKIETAAENYAQETSIITVTVAQLIENGYLTPDKGKIVYNPKNNESLNCNIVELILKNGKYKGELLDKKIEEKDGKCEDYILKYNNLINVECLGNSKEIEKCEKAFLKTNAWYTGSVKLSASNSIEGIVKYRWTSLTGFFSNEPEVIVEAPNTLSTIYNLNVTLENDKNSIYDTLIQIDNEAPIILNIENDDEWSNKDKTIIIKASDGIGSGIDKYYIGSDNKCDGEFQGSEQRILDNGTYYVCILDKVGNISKPNELIVRNIDKTAPIIAEIVKNPIKPAAFVTISTTITDLESGIFAYAINQNKEEKDVKWINIPEVLDKLDISQAITASGAYYIWAKDKMGNISKKSIDVLNIMPVITNIKTNPTTWTNSIVKISADIELNGTIIQGYSINLKNCGIFTSSTATSISKEVSVNGKYSICVKDEYGNNIESKINISNIDTTKPTIAPITKSTESWVNSLTINTTINDNESKLVAYAVNQTSNAGSVSWTNISETTNQNITHTITSAGTYYVWAKDKAGNVSNKSINVNNIGILRTSTFYTGDVNYSIYPSSFNTGYLVKGIKSMTTNNGYVSEISFSDRNIYFTLSNGIMYSRNVQNTCTYSAEYTSRRSTKSCSRYYCPLGGEVSGSRCIGQTWHGNGYNDYICNNGRWDSYYNSHNVRCDTGYTHSYSCKPKPTHTCTNNGAKWRVECSGTCTWRGNYNASCQNYQTDYYCPSGYSMVGSGCYRCSSGDQRSGTTCYYSCSYTQYYYNYYVTIEYYV